MRARFLPLRPTMLALTFTTLLAIPATAQTGSGATISMQPESAAPGTAVEIFGAGFPTEMNVDLQLITETGTFNLATAATARNGAFRHLVVLPSLPVAGAWAVEAVAADGTTARHDFDAAAPTVAPAEVVAVQDSTAPARAAAADNDAVDGVVLVILGCLLGMVSTGALYAWRMLHDERVQPGMGQADDLIWNDGREHEAAEPTATSSEPFWEASARDAEAAAREVADPGEQEAPASA